MLAYPERDAVADAQGERLTYHQADVLASKLAGWLYNIGVRNGDTVGIDLPGWAQYTVIYAACLKLGAVIVPILPSWREAEINWAVQKCGLRVIFAPTAFKHYEPVRLMADVKRRQLSVRAIVAVDKLAPLPEDLRGEPGVHVLSEILAHAPELEEEAHPFSDDVAAVLFTSGTEGMPKGAMLTHNNILASERAYAARLGLSWLDNFLMPAPLGHATGFLHGVTLPMLLGGKSVLLDIFKPDACLELLEKERCTCILGATPFVHDILAEIQKAPRDLSFLRFFLCGGTTIPPRIFAQCRRLGIKLLSVYGSTESSPHAVVNPDDSTERCERTDGYAVAGVEIKVVDDARREVPCGAEGEEASRGPNVFVGYVGEPAMTDRVLDEDGWYYSGDLCRSDAEGKYIKITGRKKDVIIRGGENISSREVEDILLDMPEVDAAAVAAMPDERLGERTCAFVVEKPDAKRLTLKDVVAFFDSRRVAKYKFPEYLVLLTSLPRTPSGKVKKAELKALIAERLKKGLPSD